MPKCRLFGRSWNVASDNFVYAGILDGTIRLIWSLCIAYSYFTSFPAPTEREPLNYFVLFFLFINTTDALLGFWLAKISSRGPMVFLKNVENIPRFALCEHMQSPRRGMRYVFYVRIPLLIVEIVCLIFGTYLVFGFANPETLLQKPGVSHMLNSEFGVPEKFYLGSQHTSLNLTSILFMQKGRDVCVKPYFVDRAEFVRFLRITKNLIMFGWTCLLVLFVKLYWMFDPLGSIDFGEVEPTTLKLIKLEKRLKWNVHMVFSQLVSLFGRAGSSAEIMDEVANILAVYLAGFNSSLTLSDIWAGLILVSAWQGSASPASHPVQPEAITSSIAVPHWMNKRNAIWYLQYASWVYSGPYRCYAVFKHHGFKAVLCSVWILLKCCWLNHPKVKDKIVENCCPCQIDNVQNVTAELKRARLLFISGKNSARELPFFVSLEERLDEKHPTIVISIRGTHSMHDAITDLSVAVAPIDREDVTWYHGEGTIFVHKGFLECAKNIIVRLSSKNKWSEFDGMFQSRQEMNLVVTGHSLGAGVAAVLALLLKDRYPNVQCFSYCSPGYVLSKNAIESSKAFIFNLFMGNDCFSRSSYSSLVSLSTEIQKVIVNSLVPKFKIQWAFFQRFCGVDSLGMLQPRRFDINADLNDNVIGLNENGSEFLHNFNPSNHKFQTSDSTVIENGQQNVGSTLPRLSYTSAKLIGLLSSKGNAAHFQDLYHPGRILYLPRQPDGSFGNWQWRDTQEFRQIIISRNMVFDHMSYNLYTKLLEPDKPFP